MDKYDDPDQVHVDAVALADIIDRQGSHIVFEAMAEHIGRRANEFGLSSEDVQYILKEHVADYTASVNERT